MWNEIAQFKPRNFKVLWYIKVNLIDIEIGTPLTKQNLHQMFDTESILWFNIVQSSWSWSITILLMAILNWFILLKSDYKSMHIKLWESSIIRILFLHYTYHSCWKFSFKILFCCFFSLLFWCRRLKKQLPLDDVTDDIVMSTSSPTFHAIKTCGISLSNETWHLITA